MKLRTFLAIFLLMTSLMLSAQNKGGIQIPLQLKQSGFVTLVVEDDKGQRIRNLVSDTYFKAGTHQVTWDGMDDLGRDIEASHHGVYAIPSKMVAVGRYHVRGLVHQDIKTNYELPVYTSGNPPWSTKDHKGGWMANHTPPQSAVAVPAANSPTGTPVIFLGSYITEGPDGMIWVDSSGKKLGGRTWIGGAWTAAPYMARDIGAKAQPGISVYVAAVWETAGNSGQGVLRISSMPKNADKPIFQFPIGSLKHDDVIIMAEIGGLAVYNDLGVVSLPKKNQLVIADLKTGKLLSTIKMEGPRGLAFDLTGRLMVISGNKLLRFDTPGAEGALGSPTEFISSGLDAPVGITTDTLGKIYISNGGESHQVIVFSLAGKLLSKFGKPGEPKAGPYDPLHMNNPTGMAVDDTGQLWVTENDYLPKRVSVWSPQGKLVRAFYGPSKYGGGGTLDPNNESRFYYAEESRGTMEFSVDWKTGTSKLVSVPYRKTNTSMNLPVRAAAPETPLYYSGRRYMTNCYNSNPTGGALTAVLFTERDGLMSPAVAMGRTDAWSAVLGPVAGGAKASAFFIWVDKNGDAKVQSEEVTYRQGKSGGVTVMSDLSFCVAQLNGEAVRFKPLGISKDGVPQYDINNAEVLAKGVFAPGSSGGDQVLAANDGSSIIMQGVQPFERYSISGTKNGSPLWSYPNVWPGLHASHEAPLPEFPGQIIGATRLAGGLFQLDATTGPLFAINSNHGMVYFFTADGLFVTTLFEPMRSGKPWNMVTAERGMDLKGLSLGEENFWPTVTATGNGKVYLVDGARSSLVKVSGLESIQRIPPITVDVTSEELKNGLALVTSQERLRQQQAPTLELKVKISDTPINVDGRDDDWSDSDWASIDKRGVKANFNSNSKPYNVKAALKVSGGKLYGFYHTGDAALLKNSFEIPMAPFKTGGALDIMIGTNPVADPRRHTPVDGDLRLLISLNRGQPVAILYKAVVSGTNKNDVVPFSSPSRTITFDQVLDITDKLEFRAGKEGDFEWSVPLEQLGLKVSGDMKFRGDLGILRGDGTRTLSRIYWNNKATAIISDVPAEAMLTPDLWGIFSLSR